MERFAHCGEKTGGTPTPTSNGELDPGPRPPPAGNRAKVSGGMLSKKTGDPVRTRIAKLFRTARAIRQPADDSLPHLAGDHLFAYWEHTLDEQQRAFVEEHTASCTHCMKWLLEIGELFERRSSPPPDPGSNSDNMR